MFSIFHKEPPINNQQLGLLLDEIITSRLEKMGLTSRSGNVWHTPSANSIRLGFRYNLLKGLSGTFAWGACLDFVPLPSGSSIKYYRTDSAFKLQLFEWTDEYANSFLEESLKNGVVVHSGLTETRRALQKLFNAYEEKIFAWFKNAGSLAGLIEIATYQVSTGKSYQLHGPHPAYILAFLLAKNGQLGEAVRYFEGLSESSFNENTALRSKLMQKLLDTGK